ncbi:MAG: hypothetical protein OXF76_15740 [Caldilineaceae bacterium]|nr:hypothetical protein [Caldilineaceae bacterium]
MKWPTKEMKRPRKASGFPAAAEDWPILNKITGVQDDEREPKAWDQEPGEPTDCYYWFRLYLTLSLPRKVAQVAKLVGTNSERTWMSKIARKWRWKERAARLDAERAQQIVVQAEMREQLLLDKLFEAQFHGLLDTTQAIENAQIDRMSCAEARRHLTPLSRHQLGLLSIILQSEGATETALQELNEVRLAQIVEDRAVIQVEERKTEMGEDFERELDRLEVEYALKPST